jgi:hypothetical protein
MTHEEVTSFLKRFDSFHTDIGEQDATLTLTDFLAKRQKERKITTDKVPSTWLVKAFDFFTGPELAALSGTTKGAIESRLRTGREAYDGVEEDINLEGDLLKVGGDIRTALMNIINSDKGRTLDKLKAIEIANKLLDEETWKQLNDKWKLLDALGQFYITTLIPQANKRMRDLVRDVADMAKEGKDIQNVDLDLRRVLKDCLSSASELKERLQQEGWLESDDNSQPA